jgi:hypothetical protein
MGEAGRLVGRDGPGADEEDDMLALVVVVVLLLIGMRKVEVTAGAVEEEVREAGDEEGLEAMVWRSSAGSLIYVRCEE